MQKTWVLMFAATLPIWTGCASGPVVPMPPTVEVLDFNSTRVSPDGIEFVGRVAIRNQMRGPLTVRQVDYGADLYERPLFDDTFAALQPMRSRATTTVTLPFRIPMSELAAHVEDVVVEDAVRVTLRGVVVPEGFDPIAFTAQKVLPIPRLPTISLDGARGNPVAGDFTVFLRVHNPNGFPMSFGQVDTHLDVNGRKYDLLRTESFGQLPANGAGRVALTMRNSHRKGIGVLINVVRNQSADFAVGGSLSCQTPHGQFVLPVELRSTAAAPGR